MAVRMDNCATGFSEIFAEKSFLYKNIVRTRWLDRPDGCTSAASNFHNRLRTFGPWGRSDRTAKLQHAISISDTHASGSRCRNKNIACTMRGSHPDGWSRIVSYHIRCTRVRTTTVRCLDGSFWTAILALRRYVSGRDTTSSERLIDLPFLDLGKNQWTVRELIGVRTCCWNVRTDQVCTEASWCDVCVLMEEARRPDQWCLSVWCPDGVTRRPDGWNSRQMGVRTGWHIVWTTDRELWNSSDFTLKSWIPVCRIITYKWFCPNKE
jgi:hypothetical protein